MPLDVSLDHLVEGLRLRRRHHRSALKDVGDLQSRSVGGGLEFERYRAFSPGDDIRTVDWRVSMLAGRLHTRVYQASERLNTVVVLDRSASMNPGGSAPSTDVTPWWAAQMVVLALATAHALSRSQVRVVLAEVDGQPECWLEPCDSLPDVQRMQRQLHAVRPGGRLGEWSLGPRDSFGRSGMVVVVSDFLGVGESDLAGLRRLAARTAVGLIQVDGHGVELAALAREGGVRLADSEMSGSLETVMVDASLRRQVQDRVDALHWTLRQTVGGGRGRAERLTLHELASRGDFLAWIQREFDALGIP